MRTRHPFFDPPAETAPATGVADRLSRRATWGTLAVLTGLLTLYGCDNAGPIEQSAQDLKENAVRMDDGTAAGPGPVETQPGSAPDQADKEDPPQP